jgi:hypothetical protein
MDAGFHLHIDSLDSRKYSVTVSIIDPVVVTGFMIKRGDNNSLIKPCTQSVESSTVEEYQILFLLGIYFKIQDMIYVKLPKK